MMPMDGSGGDGVSTPTSEVTTTTASHGLSGGSPPPFLSKTYEMVDDPATDAIVSWGPANNSFVVWNTAEFARVLLPKLFKHNNFSSFVRQLNTYGFRKVDPDRWEFANEGFLRGQKHLLKTISRRKSSQSHNQQQQPQTQNTIEVGKFGLEEEIERLKRDKNVLMQELVRLRQQQQSTDQQLNTLGQHLQGMEHRQQQMMSFLAKAMQSPGFLAQFVSQNDNNRRIVGVNKKRRLPRQGKLDGQSDVKDGQIVKYQPLINAAAKAMVMQILKFDKSPRSESFGNTPNYLIENFSSPPEGFNSRSSVKRITGVTLSEVPGVTLSEAPTNSCDSSLPTTSGYPATSSLAMPSDIHSSNAANSVPAAAPSMNLSQVQAMMPNGFSQSHAGPNGGSVPMNPIPDFMNELLEIETDKFASDADVDILDDAEKLPSINDPFWEQFFAASPLVGDAEEVDSSMHEPGDARIESGDKWDGTHNMAYLTEQMGNLASHTQLMPEIAHQNLAFSSTD
ncbi:heat stress transcription factor A-1-like isoform X1 [Zingiber officinale]|uniref:heat stress transcription factor A-1-like isoform X1 n=2 Tax=Zingiber officinale TaxID=94328 RepID=UPI001C4CD297|nr:heat stress transcription factor A-1-like isoform X1 [Zingiber officinale]